MTTYLTWFDDEQTILICRFEGEFDVVNYAVMEGQLPMLIREQNHRVDVILHLAEGASLPPLNGMLQEIEILCRIMPDNFGCFIGVGNGFLLTNPISIQVATFFKNLYFKDLRYRIWVADSIKSATQLISNFKGSATSMYRN